jgi:nicotinate-nucleotide pyrophosphorylase (carboxylating)
VARAPRSALYRDIVKRALDEDVRDGDITTDATVPSSQQARGVFLVKADCVLAGLDVAFEAFRLIEPGVRIERTSATAIRAQHGREIAVVLDRRAALLVAERTAHQFPAGGFSGIATARAPVRRRSRGRITILRHAQDDPER